MMSKYEYIPRPEEYAKPAEQPGKIVRVDYAVDNQPKHAYVYLPYGYQETQKYDILYLMHGGGDRADRFLGTDDTANEFKYALDHMIQKGEMRPVIVVSPSFYPMENVSMTPASSGKFVAVFHREFVDFLMPAVESKYSTYAQSTDREGLKASRLHRAFGGFSMGSVTTWWQFIHSLDYVSTFLPLSGDCWVLGDRAAADLPDETAAYLADVVRKSEYQAGDFHIFGATGDQDIAYDALGKQVESMKKLTDVFQFSDMTEEGNFHFILAENQYHRWEPIWDYCYDILRLIYPKE